jgi:exosortase D (VPLPA-CTERM-specific)
MGRSNGAIIPCHSQFEFERLSWNALGLVPVVFSIFLIIIGELSSVETILYIGIWACSFGILFVFYGQQIRHIVFPIAILLFIVPMPPFINRILTFQFKLAASSLSTTLLRASGVSIVREGNIIDLGVSQLQLVDACSGLRYFIPLFLIALLVGYFRNKKLWSRAILCFTVLPLSIIVNAIRIWVTGLLTVHGYESLAKDFFHNFSGIFVFLSASGILVAAASLMKRPEKRMDKAQHVDAKGVLAQTANLMAEKRVDKKKKNGSVNGQDVPIRNFVKPALIAAALCLFIASSGWALKNIPSARNLPERMSFISFPLQIGEWNGVRHDISKKVLDGLWSDDYVSATFKKPGSDNYIHLFIPFYEYQSTRHTAHAPQACMLGGGWALFNLRERQIYLDSSEGFNIVTMIWEKESHKLLGSYFFLQRGRVITNPWKNKLYLMWDAVTKRRTDGALVRVELVVSSGESNEDAFSDLKDFLVKLWPILPDYVPG